MIRFFVWLCLPLVVVAGPSARASAEPGWIENGAPAKANPARASNGGFGAQLVLTDNWAEFLDRWEKPTLGFAFTSAHSIGKGKPLTSAIIFTGCQADPAGNCSVIADFRAIDPTGKTYADQKGALVWNLPPPPGTNLQLSAENMVVSLDPPDPLGTYIVIATVTDRIAHKTLELRAPFDGK